MAVDPEEAAKRLKDAFTREWERINPYNSPFSPGGSCSGLKADNIAPSERLVLARWSEDGVTIRIVRADNRQELFSFVMPKAEALTFADDAIRLYREQAEPEEQLASRWDAMEWEELGEVAA